MSTYVSGPLREWFSKRPLASHVRRAVRAGWPPQRPRNATPGRPGRPGPARGAFKGYWPATGASVHGVVPGPANPDTDLQRDVHLDGGAHLLANERLDWFALTRCDLQNELIVHLEQNPRRRI